MKSKGIIHDVYLSKLPLLEPIHVAGRFKRVRDGRHIPDKFRVYVLKRWDFLPRLIPLQFQLYKDGEMYFFDRRELEKWSMWNKYKNLILRKSIENEISYMKMELRKLEE